MNKLFTFVFSMLFAASIAAVELPWSAAYHNELMKKVGNEIPRLARHPSFEYPNAGSEKVKDVDRCEKGKILLFGYGSLMNTESAARTVSPEALATMRPVVAFGLKRLFNYNAGTVTRWGQVGKNEKAMLNVIPKTTPGQVINGVTMQVTPEDLELLVQRETGYDLVPILVADWNKAVEEHPEINVQIAYTFLVPDEIRGGFDYTENKYYPVRGYLKATQEGALVFGENFLDFYNKTTYLADGTTSIEDWDESLCGILDPETPK